MKKMISTFLALTLFQLSPLVKAGNNDAMVDMVMNMMKKSGQVASMSTCLGISEASFLKKYKKTIQECIPKDGLEGNCLKTTAPKYFGMSFEELDKCGGDDNSDEALANKSDDIDYAELSEEEANALMKKQQVDGLAALESFAAMTQAQSAGTESSINLPVYSPSILRSHFIDGMKNGKGETTIPVATLTTKDSLTQVVEFYKKSLPSFEVVEDLGVYFFIEELPKNFTKIRFDLENIPLYFIPHIEVFKINDLGDDKTQIVISYKAK